MTAPPVKTTSTSVEVRQMDWRFEAACLSHDPELFFPIGDSGPAVMQIQQAKAICRGCPVMQECLSWALDSGQDSGVWGGMSETERLALRRRSSRLPTGR